MDKNQKRNGREEGRKEDVHKMTRRASQGRWIPKGNLHKEGGLGQITEKQQL